MRYRLFTTILFTVLSLSFFSAGAQVPFEGTAEFDRTEHDFGKIKMSDGPVSCSFTVRNISKENIVIYSVISTCGCTGVKWTKETIKPGECGTISANYNTNEGAVTFDKKLTVYISEVKRPVFLHLRGTVTK